MMLLLVAALPGFLVAATTRPRVVVGDDESRVCPALAQEFCASPGLSVCGSMICGAEPCVALRDRGATSLVKLWRCYSTKSLTPDRQHYKNNSGTHYCTRDAQITRILRTCAMPSPPAPPPGWPGFANSSAYESVVFAPGEGGYPCIRIPSVALAGDNVTLNAFAECRNFTGDGCFPLHPPHTPNALYKDLCQKQSTDAGRSWSQLRVVARNTGQGGNPVYDQRSERLLLQYIQWASRPSEGFEDGE
jgi:sialidase-1